MKRISVSWRVMQTRSAWIEVSDDATPSQILVAAVQAAKARSVGAEAIEAVHWETENGKQFGGRF